MTDTRTHVLACLPHKYVTPVRDGVTLLWHIGCHCGHSTHLGERVTWEPQPASAERVIACEWCQESLTIIEHRGGRKYHPACAKLSVQAINREYMACRRTSTPVTVEQRREICRRAALARWARRSTS